MQNNQEKLYKGKYVIALYEVDVYTFEEGCLLTIVNNIKGLLKYFSIPITQHEEQLMTMRIQYAFDKSNQTSKKIICVKGEEFKVVLLAQYKKKKGGSKNRK